ncbi:MAG: redox-sensing transcriptional repressor Rex [Sedimentisphaerales bacterium]|nr:redox-sensing transcriptional repressor Rex [Sedimentisphaerales bacterium]
MKYRKIPNETVRRLPVYLRGLAQLSQQGVFSVSSSKLADFVNINAWQIRKDFSYFGDFGTRGVGYSIERLSKQIKKILRLDTLHKAAVIGAGNLGSAVLAYPGFRTYGFDIAAAFDSDPEKIGKNINNIVVEDVSRLNALRKRQVDIAIIAVPEKAAQQVTDSLVRAGIKGILNFSPKRISVPKKVKVITIDIASDLARLPYYIPSG